MKRTTPLVRRTPLRRHAKSSRRYKAIRDRLKERAGGRCERCGMATNDRDGSLKQFQAHHRVLRSQGGPDNLTNLGGICRTCHDWAHAWPARARETGWIVPSWVDPAGVPVQPLSGPPVLLHNDGTVSLWVGDAA